MNGLITILSIIIQAGVGVYFFGNAIWLFISTKELKFKSVYMETLHINQKQQDFNSFKTEALKLQTPP